MDRRSRLAEVGIAVRTLGFWENAATWIWEGLAREKLRSGGSKEASMQSELQRRMGGAVRENADGTRRADAEAGRRRRDGRAVGVDQIVSV
jgi:hypothetical protein